MRSLLAMALCVAVAMPAAADKPKDKEKGKDKGKDKGRSEQVEADVSVTLTFGSKQRDAVRDYFARSHGRGNCPPGLAKKNNGCLPPGQAKKRYVVGQPLPAGIRPGPLPAEIEVYVGPAPRGYSYGIVDGDVVKLVVGTLLVVDAIDGLVD